MRDFFNGSHTAPTKEALGLAVTEKPDAAGRWSDKPEVLPNFTGDWQGTTDREAENGGATMDEIVMTRHGEKRIRKRLGVNKKAVERLAERALAHGITHAEARGGLCRYMDALFLSHNTGNNMRIYNRAVYIFQATALITVFPLPKRYIDQADKLQRAKAACCG